MRLRLCFSGVAFCRFRARALKDPRGRQARPVDRVGRRTPGSAHRHPCQWLPVPRELIFTFTM